MRRARSPPLETGSSSLSLSTRRTSSSMQTSLSSPTMRQVPRSFVPCSTRSRLSSRDTWSLSTPLSRKCRACFGSTLFFSRLHHHNSQVPQPVRWPGQRDVRLQEAIQCHLGRSVRQQLHSHLHPEPLWYSHKQGFQLRQPDWCQRFHRTVRKQG